jgi:hypothetical protein
MFSPTMVFQEGCHNPIFDHFILIIIILFTENGEKNDKKK